jgi:CheY-like chemotaxis protein
MKNSYSILIVENDEDEQFFIREGFQTSDRFQILALLRNGNELFEWLEAHPESRPDLVLSDLNMPGKNGYDIIRELQLHPVHAAVPVIITSTSSAPMIIQRCLTMGAAHYLVKPDTFVEYPQFVSRLYAVVQGGVPER